MKLKIGKLIRGKKKPEIGGRIFGKNIKMMRNDWRYDVLFGR
jgi:hypothetical protein